MDFSVKSVFLIISPKNLPDLAFFVIQLIPLPQIPFPKCRRGRRSNPCLCRPARYQHFSRDNKLAASVPLEPVEHRRENPNFDLSPGRHKTDKPQPTVVVIGGILSSTADAGAVAGALCLRRMLSGADKSEQEVAPVPQIV
jgi:hypothetical protein